MKKIASPALLLLATFAICSTTPAAAQSPGKRLLAAKQVPAAARTISGFVRDAEGDPIAGVTIAFKNSRNTATTNEEGKYAIAVPDGNVTLQFTMPGYLSVQADPGDDRQFSVTMNASKETIRKTPIRPNTVLIK